MKKSTPIRIDTEIYTAAATAAPLMSRSATQQVAHWARIGRELEASAGVSVEHVARVLDGGGDYDGLNVDEQAVVRAHWEEGITQRLGSLRMDRVFQEEGKPYVELDASGAVVRREPDSGD